MARILKSKVLEFKLHAPIAKRVSLVGTFNSWDTKKHLARKDSQGNWKTKISLKPGRHEYKFFVDGNWVNDPNCKAYVPNNLGSQNCVVEVK